MTPEPDASLRGVPLTGARRGELTEVVRRAYRGGATIRDAARQVGRSYGSTRQLLIEAGEPRRPQRGPVRDRTIPHRPAATTATAEAVRELSNARREARDDLRANVSHGYRAGATIRELMATTGQSYGLVRTLLLEAGVILRPRGTRPRVPPA